MADEGPKPGSRVLFIFVVLCCLIVIGALGSLLPSEPKASPKGSQLPANIRHVETAGTPCRAWVVAVDDAEYLVVSHRSGLAVVKHKGK